MLILRNPTYQNPLEARTVVWIGVGLAVAAAGVYAYHSYRRSSCVSAWYDPEAKRLAEASSIEASAQMAAMFAAQPMKYKGNPVILAEDTFNVLWETGTFSREPCSGWGDAREEVKPLVMPSLIAMAIVRTGGGGGPGGP